MYCTMYVAMQFPVCLYYACSSVTQWLCVWLSDCVCDSVTVCVTQWLYAYVCDLVTVDDPPRERVDLLDPWVFGIIKAQSNSQSLWETENWLKSRRRRTLTRICAHTHSPMTVCVWLSIICVWPVSVCVCDYWVCMCLLLDTVITQGRSIGKISAPIAEQ